MNYVSLHNHTDASLDGAGTVTALVAQARKLGMTALAMTDHGTLANAVAFWSACQEAEIKPILGMEAYLQYNGKRHHLTLLSMSEKGFNNLLYLNNHAHQKHFSGGYPLITLENLEHYRGDIFALTGCAASALYEGEESDGRIFLSNLLDVMTVSQVGMEVMFVGAHNTWSRPYLFGKEYNIPHFITNDTHYPCRNQFPAHQAICTARHGFTYDSQHLWLKTGTEIMHEGIRYVDDLYLSEGFKNTLEFAYGVEAWSMAAKPTLPAIPDVENILQNALRTALKQDVEVKGERDKRLERLRYEFRILHERKFLDYIYILWDIVTWAKEQGIYVGPGRGSGGGSYVLYLLGITGIDPLNFGLLFERFINLARNDYPDVDVDFEAERRGEVFEYAAKKWGTIPIATYSTYSHKSAIHDIARVLHIPKDLEVPASESGCDSDAFETFLADKPDAHITYQTMVGQIRHRGKHAAGVIIPNRPVPIERAGSDGDLVAAWAEGGNSKDLSKVGIVKYDILGLSALSMLKRMGELTDIPVSAIEWDMTDSEVYDLFCNGDVAGIFQWSGSEGIRDLTVRIQPRNFYDLTTCNALYRPGALHAGTAERYPEYMKEPRRLHSRLDPLLEKTYGVLCYQEQVMAVIAEMMGGDLVQAEVARRLLSKAAHGDLKWERDIQELSDCFHSKAAEQGFPRGLVEQMWNEVYTHSGYSYNLCLSGSTVVERDNSGRGAPTPFITLKELHEAWNSKTPWGKKLRSKGVKITCLCEDGKIRPRRVKGVHYNGKKQVFRVRLRNGMVIDATHNHRLLTLQGYKRVDELHVGDSLIVENRESKKERDQSGRYVPKYIRDSIKNRAAGKCEQCGKLYDGTQFEFAHTEPYLHTPENIRWLCNSCHKRFDTEKGERPPRWAHGRPHTTSEIILLQGYRVEDVYDVEMAEEPHNFIANGIVSHNSHATAYTLISYQMAWYKAHFRPEFTVAVLQHDKANAQTYILDAVAHGLKVAMPDVNHSTKNYELKRGAIWLPLTDVAHVGEAAVDAILEARKESPFVDYKEFADRVPKKKCNNRTKQNLERIGAFAFVLGDPTDAIDKYEEIPVKGKYQTQLELLGYVVPSRDLYNKIEEVRKRPAPKGKLRFAGFVREIKQKKSDHGAYCVFNLSPEGSFWIRGEEAAKKFPVGTFVSGTKSTFGHSNDCRKYRLDTGE